MDDNYLTMFSLKGKVALVTGGSSGIGFAMACALAKAGAALVFNGRNEERLAKAEEEFRRLGIDAHGYVCDVSDERQVRQVVPAIEKEVGPIDILVNNAGIIKRIPICEMDVAAFRQVIDIDLVGPFIMVKAVLPGMMRRKRGKIINVCSIMSELGRETVSAYAAAKGGLKMLTRAVCAEVGDANIQCNGIGPGFIETPLTDPLRAVQPDGSPHPFDAFLRSKTPAGRWGKTADLEGPVVFLASSASDFVNGQILYVDGGLLASFGKQPQ